MTGMPYLPDEVVGLSEDGHILIWNETAQLIENTGETVEEFGVDNLTMYERPRVGLTN